MQLIPIKHGGHTVAEVALQIRSMFIVPITLSALQCMTVHKMFVFIIIIPFESGERVSFAITLFLTIVVFFT